MQGCLTIAGLLMTVIQGKQGKKEKEQSKVTSNAGSAFALKSSSIILRNPSRAAIKIGDIP